MKMPRGLRNNNPGNLRISAVAWLGKRAVSHENEYETFIDMTHGVRAMAINAITAQSRHGCRTVRQLIQRWAPQHENDTWAYVMRVAHAIGVDPDEPIELRDRKTLVAFVWAVAAHENGIRACEKYLKREDVERGVDLALAAALGNA
ncbi:MAG TPA: structural protein [Methylococcus sp.]|nr:structural protein [Methylococcus sp.]